MKLVITKDPEIVEAAQDIAGNICNNYIRVENPFNNMITEFLERINTNKLIQRVFAQIKAQVENLRMSESGFALDQVIYQHINFHKLMLTQESSYIKLLEWIVKKKTVTNKEANNEQCFKWAVIAALRHEEISKHPQSISKLQHDGDQNNWHGIELPLAIQKIGKSEKNNHDIPVNVLVNSKKGIYTTCKSRSNRECSKQANLLMILNEEKCTTQQSRICQGLNMKSNWELHFYMNCFNGFCTVSARDK